MKCLCGGCTGKNVSDKCFQDLWFFDDLTEEQFQALREIGLKREVKKGRFVFMQGDAVDEVFLIKAGRIRLGKVYPDGSELTLDFRKAGDVIGEHLFVGEAAYPFTAEAMEDTVTCGFNLHSFSDLVRERPEIGLNVIKSMSNKLAVMTDRLENAAGGSLEHRLFGILRNVAREHGQEVADGIEIPFPLTHEEIAFLVGAHRVSVTKVMQSLSQQSRIITNSKKITLTGSSLSEL